MQLNSLKHKLMSMYLPIIVHLFVYIDSTYINTCIQVQEWMKRRYEGEGEGEGEWSWVEVELLRNKIILYSISLVSP